MASDTPNSSGVAPETSQNKFVQELKRRTSQIKKTRWWRFGIVALIYTAWVIWLNNYWFLLGLVLLFDIYITGFIPFTWWKNSKNAAVRTVMSWVDAIVYALVLVYFIFGFVGQNYQIPSSSLEKTLLTGDYLWVNKLVYGPRVPITPVNFPLVHNTMPIIGGKSYLDTPSNAYRRLPGLRNVESGDIVVFNFPAGDTVALKYEETPEYYETLVDRYGWAEVNTNKAQFGDVIYRPVDRRTNFVKRAVGLPGERLKIVDDVIYINGKAQKQPENVQFRYLAALTSPLTDQTMKELEITASDVMSISPDAGILPHLMPYLPGATTKDAITVLPMTEGMIKALTATGQLKSYVKLSKLNVEELPALFPKVLSEDWTLSNYGGDNGILIPKKGMTVEMTPENWALYERVIRNYENHPEARLVGDVVYMGDKPIKNYTFEMDYYFMMGDNRDMSQDSRFWGFVPEDHIVGTPMVVLISFDRDRSMLDGGIRWNRILKSANPDK
jgi:signal peptidase I